MFLIPNPCASHVVCTSPHVVTKCCLVFCGPRSWWGTYFQGGYNLCGSIYIIHAEMGLFVLSFHSLLFSWCVVLFILDPFESRSFPSAELGYITEWTCTGFPMWVPCWIEKFIIYDSGYLIVPLYGFLRIVRCVPSSHWFHCEFFGFIYSVDINVVYFVIVPPLGSGSDHLIDIVVNSLEAGLGGVQFFWHLFLLPNI